MASTQVERIQAPFGGLNTDASPDYVGAVQAPTLENLLPGIAGKVICRGGITQGITTTSYISQSWSHDDIVLATMADATVKRFDLDALTVSDVTASVAVRPANNVCTRYGASTYGACTASPNPGLAKWDGATSSVLQTNAPYQFKDVQVHAKRLFVLGGTAPGTTTPVVNEHRTLFWTDPNPAADLTLTASWTDDISGLVNQLQYDADDTPVGLAGCGKYMAILGTKSINILTGSGSSSFAIRNLSRNLGAVNVESIVEVDDGFYFLSDRGYCFCDGSSVRVVSDGTNTRLFSNSSGVLATAANGGYVAVGASGGTLLYHIASQTWTRVSSSLCGGPQQRTTSFPWVFDVASSTLWLCDKITVPRSGSGRDSGGVGITATWKSRAVRLGSPVAAATVKRVVVDYLAIYSNFPAGLGWKVNVLNAAYPTTTLATADLDGQPTSSSTFKQRATIDVHGEVELMQIEITWPFTSGAPEMSHMEIFDVWVEFVPAYETAGF